MKHIKLFEEFIFENKEVSEVKSLQSKMGVRGMVSDNGPNGVQLLKKENQLSYQFDWDLKTGNVNVTIFERNKVVKTESFEKKASTAEEFLTIIKTYED